MWNLQRGILAARAAILVFAVLACTALPCQAHPTTGYNTNTISALKMEAWAQLVAPSDLSHYAKNATITFSSDGAHKYKLTNMASGAQDHTYSYDFGIERYVDSVPTRIAGTSQTDIIWAAAYRGTLDYTPNPALSATWSFGYDATYQASATTEVSTGNGGTAYADHLHTFYIDP